MRSLALVVLAACYQHAPYMRDDGPRPGDALTVDLPADMAAPQGCSAYLPSVCVGTGMSGIADPFATDNCSMLVINASGSYCLVRGGTVTINTHIHVVGPYPLVIAADTIMIESGGDLDASSDNGTSPRIGAGSTMCAWAGTATVYGGGAGGSYGSLGGHGGKGGSGLGGAAGSKMIPTQVIGGCAGEQPGANGGAGGYGGGAIWLFAATSITVAGTMEANGAGGYGGTPSVGGGGGGGSGGLLVLESPTLALAGSTFGANGGGGGGGSYLGMNGKPGEDGAFLVAANGGMGLPGSSPSGSGGTGGFGPADGMFGGDSLSAGGGGGGGGVGWIFFHGNVTSQPVVVSPPNH